MAKIAVIGSGFSGLSAAAFLSKAGHQVEVFEKNDQPGGRARQLKTPEGYVFDMGPSWYWMPGVFEKFFNDLGSQVSQLYDLRLLDPSFTVVTGKSSFINIPAGYAELRNLFESIEPGSAYALDRFMKEAQFKYETGMEKLVYQPGLSFTELFDSNLLTGAIRLQVFSSFSKHVRKYFSHPVLISIMEFPVLFLGAMPSQTPALYSLMNYAGLKLGTWYPNGGFGKVVKSIVSIAESYGAVFHYSSPVEKIFVEGKKANAILVNGQKKYFDSIVASADYAFVENELIDEPYRNYNKGYWNKKIMAPSCLIFFVGLNRKLKNLQHHTLFFDEDFNAHAKEIYTKPQWPTRPLFYLCNPSKTDNSVAPEGHENLFFLMPLAAGLEDNEELREKYFAVMLERLEQHSGERELEAHIDFKKSYCINDFTNDYHSYKGNAYGLANTLFQTAQFKPSIRNRKLSNLFYTGQLTVPGPGVPPSLISGQIAAKQVLKYLKGIPHEGIV
jgi:phytoene desaturase